KKLPLNALLQLRLPPATDNPPSTVKICPVTQDEAAEHKKAAAAATTSGFPKDFNGYCSVTSCSLPSYIALANSVLISAVQIAFTRISGPSSASSVRVRCEPPALLMPYSPNPAPGISEVTEERLTTRP